MDVSRLSAKRVRWFWRSLDRLDESGNAFRDGCWNWRFGRRGPGAVKGAGYGTVAVNGKQEGAHRVAYELAIGPIPDGLWVLHTCDNSLCCNPKHLYAGTSQQNVQDAIDRGHRPSQLSASQADEVRKLRASGLTLAVIAARYGVTRSAIQQICTGKTHKISGSTAEAPTTSRR